MIVGCLTRNKGARECPARAKQGCPTSRRCPSRPTSFFACGWLKKKADATGEELAEAAKARAEQEKKQSEQLKAAELAAALASDKPKAAGKQLSRNPHAVRKRSLRGKEKRKKKQAPKPRDKAATDAEKAALRTPTQHDPRKQGRPGASWGAKQRCPQGLWGVSDYPSYSI